MHKTLVTFAFLLLLPAANSLAGTVTATGTIESIDAKGRTIKVLRKTAKGEKSGTFSISPKAEVLVAGKAADLDSLAEGQTVTVTYDTTAKQVTKIDAHVVGAAPAIPGSVPAASAIPENTVAWFLSKAEAELAGIQDANEISGLIAQIASVRAAHKEYDAAQKTLEQLSGRGRDNVLMSLATAMAADHEFEKALETAQQIADPDFAAYALQSIAKEQDASGDNTSARQTLEEARSKAKSVLPLTLNAVQQFALGDKAGARRSFETAAHLEGDTRLSVEERAVFQLVTVMMQSRTYGDKEVKLDVLADAIRQTKHLPNANNKWPWFQRLVLEYVALGEIETAKKLALSIPVISSGTKDVVYREIVTEQLKLHDVKGARESFRQVKDSTTKSQLLIEFAITEARNGDLTKATSAALKMPASGEKVASLLAVAKAQLDNGRSNLACDTLSTAEQVAESLPVDNNGQRVSNGQQVSFEHCLTFATEIIKSGASDQGHGKQLALKMRVQQRDAALFRICSALADTKRGAEAKEILLEGRLGTFSPYAARLIAKAEIASQELPLSPEWIGKLSNRPERLSAYLGCAEALIEKEMGEGK